ncbi:MAG: hypothetical protein AUK47_24765 [Deltaproteobacteria bacterium CG2_30_63_29]|nr:MAG: hypothetical protein AUK47_24765 [Deltaproteobacteria bacterium CG2_30_63_29]PIW02584.1 MAG: hypothetical protein COW42_00860 [Deltaproteobacteria bacterium CG17_big_fil_post_rev_8_21_14_2_50_63_7]PJB36745.1 MAG: hypothetical protein CO108_22705 [Deltaproteobacteria bacterium CG_4_9_14_3_um_filter_63_12]
MKPQSRDTHPEVERVQLELLRRASVAQRFARVRSLSMMTFQLAFRALERANPALSQDELFVLFVKLHHGESLAAKLRTDLERRGRL